MLELRSAEAFGKASKSKDLLEQKDRQIMTQRGEIDFLTTQRDALQTQRDNPGATHRGRLAAARNAPVAAVVPGGFSLPSKAEIEDRGLGRR